VTDPSDAAIVQAKVTLASVGGGLSFTATSGEDGLYQFSRVAPGRYVLTFEDPQFARTVLDDVAIAVNEQALDVPQTALNSALFGQVTSTMPGFGPRQMQFAMKLTF
jgi:hypothetical protein